MSLTEPETPPLSVGLGLKQVYHVQAIVVCEGMGYRALGYDDENSSIGAVVEGLFREVGVREHILSFSVTEDVL